MLTYIDNIVEISRCPCVQEVIDIMIKIKTPIHTLRLNDCGHIIRLSNIDKLTINNRTTFKLEQLGDTHIDSFDEKSITLLMNYLEN